MNEKLMEILVKYIDKVGGFIEKGVDLAIQEVPKIITEYLEWAAYESIIDIIVGSLSLILLIILSISLFKFTKFLVKKEEDDFIYLFNGFQIIIFIIFIGVTSSLVGNFKKLIKIKVAPRIFLIETATTYYKNLKK